MSKANTKNDAVQKNVGRPAGRKNSSIRADRLEVIQKVAEKLITGMALASSSELAKVIWPEIVQDKIALNAKSKTVRLSLQNIIENQELAAVPQEALRTALGIRGGQKRDPMDIEKEKEAKEAVRRSRLELQKKEWMSQPIRLMESRIKAMIKESLGIYAGEGVAQLSPMPSFDVKVAANTFNRESVLRVLELELKIQLHTVLRYTWNGEEAWEFLMKAKELIRIKKKLYKSIGLSREETDSFALQVKQLREDVEQAYEKMNVRKGWADPDLNASQQLSSYNQKDKVMQYHTEQVESWAAERLPAEVEIASDARYPDAEKPWTNEPLQSLECRSIRKCVPINGQIMKRDIANAISSKLLRLAEIDKEKPKDNNDFYTSEDLEYLCMFYEQKHVKEVGKVLGKSVSSVMKKYQWLAKLQLIDYYKERFRQKEKPRTKPRTKENSQTHYNG
ncbi:hypothetical protein [Desulfosporosinus nitroreducens]|uniref:Uncharacterized protein n=1 Tax=Desulfosporosinus nitroreducens TaxID=2018668 RepID=A0ABT8QRU3_9FIRM|nr:hypothetical protein [Desulfosporosinus nitroreducens]MDO0824046.1 hypothetical protein [Desulfosporosinus nitroreducens]